MGCREPECTSFGYSDSVTQLGAKILNAGKYEMSSLYFQLFLSNGGRNEFNRKIPMFCPNDAIISSQNQDDLFGIRNSRHESTQRLPS